MTTEAFSGNSNGREATVLPVKEIAETIAKNIDEAKRQIEIITPALRALAEKIESEKPDLLVFLDLSARILATPYLKYLHGRMGDEAPLVRFYNDNELKGRFLAKDDLDEVAQQDFATIHNKKVFFIDETFSNGKGAAALLMAAEKTNVDGYYFALTKDPSPSELFELDGSDAQFVEENIGSNRIVVYNHVVKNLFSRFFSRLYVQDFQGETLPLHSKEKEQESSGSIPDPDSYTIPPEGMTIEEYTKAVAELYHTSVQQIKDLVYEALVGKNV